MLDCKKGCGKCCEVAGTVQQLIATEAEAIAIGKAAGREPILSAGRGLSGILFGVQKAAPCPFLEDGACTVYDVRPAVCRAYQCNGQDQWVKSEQAIVDCTKVATGIIENSEPCADLRAWFPEDVASAMARHDKIAFQFSGGKDSTALLLSMRGYWDRMTVYHLDTGDMHPETREVVDAIARMVPSFQRIQSDVFAVKAEFGLPSDVIPWSSTERAHQCNAGFSLPMQDRVSCCFRTTMVPLYERMVRDGVTLVIRGQKHRDELKGALFSGDVVEGIEYLYPFSDRTDEECFDIMREHGIAVPAYYTEGLVHSGDCMGCTAWCAEETRAEYLKKYHPKRYPLYREEMIQIAEAVADAAKGVFRAANACMSEE